MSGWNARVRMFAVALPALLVVAGCSVIAGVDFGNAHERLEPGAGEGEGGIDDDAGAMGITPDATPTGCSADQKTCNGACVAKNDPAYGCEAADCLPCSVAFAKSATCKAGACAADGCAAERGDCDGDTKNGCESSFSSPTTCGNCNTKCAAPTALCAPTGCVSSCPGGLTECNGACVDTKTSLDHCGLCGRKCVAPANGDPVCLNSSCAFACRTGFGDCVDNPAKACNALPKWYRDADNDGVGTAVSVQACAAPAGHVAASGDCLDTNPQVKPGQNLFFGASFINAAGAESYDYDCSGVEVENGTEHFVGCDPAACDSYGNLPRSPARVAGAGVNSYCGSTSARYCVDNGGGGPLPIQQQQMMSVIPQLAPGCRPYSQTSPPVPCH